MLNTPIPADLCLLHREQFRGYRDNHYSPWNPTEWPGGSHIMDSRVSHAERDRDWDRKNLRIMQDIADQCRSDRIPGCAGDVTPTPATCGPPTQTSRPAVGGPHP